MDKESFLSFARRHLGIELKIPKSKEEILKKQAEQVRQREREELEGLMDAVQDDIVIVRKGWPTPDDDPISG